jgi:hypothetical protein
MASVLSSNVTDKISAILKCQMIAGTVSEKSGRTGEKYLAVSELNPDIISLLLSGTNYKATAKVDGTCTFVKEGQLMKRREIYPGSQIPKSWFQTGNESKEGHLIGFMPLEKGDKWHYDCHVKIDSKNYDMTKIKVIDINPDGSGLIITNVDIATMEGNSVEVMGPKWLSNPHHLTEQCIMRHGLIVISDFPDLSEYAKDDKLDVLSAIKNWFTTNPKGNYIEGVVIHFENGMMFKIHKHHLDLEWNPEKVLPLMEISL